MNAKQQAFVEHYLQCWNASKAARLAGYSEKNSDVVGPRLLGNVGISRAIRARLEGMQLDADEVLRRLAETARGSLDEFVTAKGEIDLAAAKRNGSLRLAKRVKVQHGKIESVEVELHDPLRAMELLGKHLALFGGLTGDVNDAIEQLLARLASGGKAETGTEAPEAGQPERGAGATGSGS